MSGTRAASICQHWTRAWRGESYAVRALPMVPATPEWNQASTQDQQGNIDRADLVRQSLHAEFVCESRQVTISFNLAKGKNAFQYGTN